MSGKSFLKELLRELPKRKTNPDLDRLESRHDSIFRRSIPRLCSLPGANQLLNHLARHHVPMAIATTGGQAQTSLLLKHLDLPRTMEIVTGDDVEKAKPSPDLSVPAPERLHGGISNCSVVGDSV